MGVQGSRARWWCAVLATGALTSWACTAITSPTDTARTVVESFAAAVRVFDGDRPPTYQGVWRGAYILSDCRALVPLSCKDFPRQEPVRLELTQRGASLSGIFEGLSTRSDFIGTITKESGIAGVASLSVSIRLTRSGESFTGYIVRDSYQASSLSMTKRYDIAVPLTRSE